MNRATRGLGLGLAHGATLEDFLDRLDQVMSTGIDLSRTNGVLIVDPTSVANRSALVEDDDLRHTPGTDPGGQASVAVDNDGEIKVMSAGKSSQFIDRGRIFARDTNKRDALPRKSGGNPGEPIAVEFGQRTIGLDPCENDDLAILKV
jgi:hypothetical protein